VPGQPPPAESRATDQAGGASIIERWRKDEELLRRVQDLRPIAEQAGLSLAQLAVAWVLQNQNVAAAIVGASRPEQVAENAKASGVTLEADVMKAIDEVLGDHIVRDPSITATRSPVAE
jgi:aryl-alcohol dehydrogenase-like predicted oxidoreductase